MSTDPTKPKVNRRTADGHLDPQYAKELLEKSGKSSNDTSDRAFFGKSRAGDELAEDLGENFVQSATSGEEDFADRQDERTEAESGGPFVVSPAGAEFAADSESSDPPDATREPFPTA